MTNPDILEILIKKCPEESCARCRYGYVEDWDIYGSGAFELTFWNLSTSCGRIYPDDRHVGSHVRAHGHCKDFQPASAIMVYPRRSTDMIHKGVWWTDLCKVRTEPPKNTTLDRWVSFQTAKYDKCDNMPGSATQKE